MKILPLLQQSFPTATGYDNLTTVVQANAEGHLVKVHYAENWDVVDPLRPCPSTAFVKTVDAAQYSEEKKSWADLRRTLMYCRTEVRFYTEILPELISSSSSSLFANATPKIFLAECDLDGLLLEQGATDPSGEGPVDTDWKSNGNADQKGGFLVMEGISSDDYFQNSPISVDQAKQTLAAIAGLHAAAWQDVKLLTKAEQRLSRGSYHLKTRNPKELEGMSEAWTHFVNAFQHLDTTGIFQKCGADFGLRIQNLAEYVCRHTSPSPTDQYATISHGDFKSMNCFLPKTEASHERGVVMVDFASVGVGFGMQDVGMHIHHAVQPVDLANGGEMRLVEHYLAVLNDHLNLRGLDYYPQEVAMRHYRLAVVDYFRFFLGRFWKSATPASFAKKASSKNTALINRDVEAAFAFLDRVHDYVVKVEAERASSGVCAASGTS
ncbi:ecdysteroid kinase [Nitzschia inconspicua]|uniref:Ecdysteroid kinase n=1 Tax=Nitzschia inconspicua TaxID=303405 RepID=A0A9K3Q4J1_9STRA|nr:ecdysteroid kinase [Nitzschia inconspicua]